MSSELTKPLQFRLLDVVAQKQAREFATKIGRITEIPLLSGRLLTDLAIDNGATVKIAHGLGRKLRGFILVDLVGASAGGSLVRVLDTSLDPKTHLAITAVDYGATVTVSLYVF